MRTLLQAAVGVAVLTAAGCGGGTADLSGKVAFQGKPVVFGSVVVIGADGVPKSGVIQPDGTFRVDGVRAGSVKITVSSPPPPGAAAAKKGREDIDPSKVLKEAPVNPEVAKNWFPIPDRYADPDKSGLGQSLSPGSNQIDLDLK